MTRVITADEAAALIPDGAVVTVSSSSGLGCPDRVLRAIGERFEATGSPRGLLAALPALRLVTPWRKPWPYVANSITLSLTRQSRDARMMTSDSFSTPSSFRSSTFSAPLWMSA